MLAWLVIDRTYPRQFLPKSSSLRTLCLCVGFSDSLRPASVVPTTYALPLATVAPKPLCNQSVTHSFYLDGGCIPVHTPPWRSPHDSDPLECLSHVPYLLYFQSRAHSFALFCTPQKLNSFIFKRFRTLLQKTQPPGGGGRGTSVIRKFVQFSWNFSAAKVGNFLSAPRHASHESQSPITSSRTPIRP